MRSALLIALAIQSATASTGDRLADQLELRQAEQSPDALELAWDRYFDCVSNAAKLFGRQRQESSTTIAKAAIRFCFVERERYIDAFLEIRTRAGLPGGRAAAEEVANKNAAFLPDEIASQVIANRAVEMVSQDQKLKRP